MTQTDAPPAAPALVVDVSDQGELEAEAAQVRTRDRVRELAEVFTHKREVDAMLDMLPATVFTDVDAKFLEPACGSGNFVVEILARKLAAVTRDAADDQGTGEYLMLRAVASIYGVDISEQNITEARARAALVLTRHYHRQWPTIEPSAGFQSAAVLILHSNLVVGDTLNAADQIELCDWQPHSDGRFQRVWSNALVPEEEQDLFSVDRVQDPEPVHYSQLSNVEPGEG